MNYRHISTLEPVARYMADSLAKHLAIGQHVSWLIGGGSGINVSLQTATELQRLNVNLANLSVTLTDERYGTLGHKDENWQQLLDRGFSLPGASLHRVLSGHDRATTTHQFSAILHDLLDDTDFSLGFFGIGADGHTAGIKPDSPAVTAEAYAADFAGPDFERITMTGPAIKQLDEVVIYAVGADKRAVLHQLLTETVPVNDQPAQLLKTVVKSTLFTDLKES